MRPACQLAYRNLVGAGLRTRLNIIVLSLVFIIILFFNGMFVRYATFVLHHGKKMSVSKASQEMSVAIADCIYSVYTSTLFFSTMALLVISAIVISFLPAWQITKLNPVLTIKRKIQ